MHSSILPYRLQEWWTHLWLNEGFASWIEYLCVDHCLPEFDIWTQFVSSDYAPALELDALDNSHPIEVTLPWVLWVLCVDGCSTVSCLSCVLIPDWVRLDKNITDITVHCQLLPLPYIPSTLFGLECKLYTLKSIDWKDRPLCADAFAEFVRVYLSDKHDLPYVGVLDS